MIMKDMPSWGELATFVPNKKTPVYNWFYYKEGYSREIVMKLIDRFCLKSGNVVLDPFCGVGTTLLSCRERGIESIGFDVNPVAVFSSAVKTGEYDASALSESSKELFKKRFVKPDISGVSRFVRRAFNRHTLDDVFFFREEIKKLDPETRDFMMLALMNVAMKCSYAWKDGAVIKIRKHPVPPLRKLLKRQVKRMIKDVMSVKMNVPCKVSFGDARKMKLDSESVDGVITSPPYLNKIEYTKIYSIEEELFFREMNNPALRSFIGNEKLKVLSEKNALHNIMDTSGLPVSVIAYFNDMGRVIDELFRVCGSGAKVGMIVGNGCFPDRVIDSDVILNRLAGERGFSPKETLVLNKRWCTRNRVEKVGMTRESLLIWEKT